MTIKNNQLEDAPRVLSNTPAPPTGAGKGAFFPKDPGTGRIEGHYVDNQGVETQITENGSIVAVGEANDGLNIGAGQGNVFAQKNGVSLEFKTILAGAGITIVDNADTIEVSTSTDAGEANTASNVGAGNEIFKQKSGIDLEFRSIVAGAGIAIATSTDEITITNLGSAGEANTGTNIGGGSEVFKAKNGVDFEFRTITAGAGIVITQNADTLEITNTGGGGGGGGESNSGANLGGGEGVFAQKNGLNLEFKSIVAGSGISLASSADEITITATGGGGGSGEANDGANLGPASDADVFKQKSGVDLEFRRLTAGANVTITQNANDIEISATGGGGGGGGGTTAFITVPTGGSLSARLSSATGIPAGWSLVEGNDPAVDAGLTSVGVGAGDVVIITGEGKSPGSVKVMKDFGGLVRQQAFFSASSGDILESNNYNQILLKSYEDPAKAGTAQSEIVVIMPA